MNLPLCNLWTSPRPHLCYWKDRFDAVISCMVLLKGGSKAERQGAPAVLSQGGSFSADRCTAFVSFCLLFLYLPACTNWKGRGFSGRSVLPIPVPHLLSWHDATSKMSLGSEQTAAQMIPGREAQARRGQWQVEEDDALRSQPRHQPFLHWQFLPFISSHCVPSLTGLLIHLGPWNIKWYSAHCEIILCLSSSDLETTCHRSGPSQPWTHRLLINKTSNSAK